LIGIIIGVASVVTVVRQSADLNTYVVDKVTKSRQQHFMIGALRNGRLSTKFEQMNRRTSN